ncbi:MAG: DNA phosphorothioation system sulfurtransferase DndC [Pseudomonadales bacterium]|nr:DNA phosphorothioation system sulfurtransferase DndC [Pseudomonadales bacterium]
MSAEETFLYNSQEKLIEALAPSGRPLSDLIAEIQSIYLNDKRPWIIGFSGGKDSTCVLSLVYTALKQLRTKERSKPVYVVSSDTLVETPVVVDMINRVLNTINIQAGKHKIPMTAHAVFPKSDQTFWVNLLGRGYPAPRQSFRWCTERMKIDPVSDFIKSKVAQFGEVIVVLGSRSQESSSRAQVIAKHRIDGSALSRHSSLPNAYTYMPIEEWSADDVWEFLMSGPCPWGGSNRELFELYKGSNQGECPLVIDKSTPSCGNSRFGCWTCTVVNEDKALHGLIESGEKWMKPLLEFRNTLYESTKPELKNKYRNYKRRTGKVTYMRGSIEDDSHTQRKHVPGPYWMNQRKEWLKELLKIEKELRDQGHKITLIQEDELQAIRQQWLRDPNEPDWADTLPKIYGEIYEDDIDWIENDAGAFTAPDAALLNELGKKHGIPAELIMKLLEVELSVSGLGKRKGVIQKLESIINQDWESLDAINARNIEAERNNVWTDKLESLKSLYIAAPKQ